MLQISNLHAEIEKKSILHGLDLAVGKGEVHVIMGPNGSGKSTLANILAGHPSYGVTEGSVEFEGESLVGMAADQIAKKGVFLTFQQPREVGGVHVKQYLQTINTEAVLQRYGASSIEEARKNPEAKTALSPLSFRTELRKMIKDIGFDDTMEDRSLNVGFSGGEKKRSEILQMKVLKPKLVILDEFDSGLDIDALKNLCEQVREMVDQGMTLIVITHYSRMLEYFDVDHVHLFADGKIVRSGGVEMVSEIEDKGLENIISAS